jgi:hypothetical protein
MMKKKIKILLILGLFFVSAGGGWVHYKYHPYGTTGFGWVPFIAGLISIFLLPVLFYFRKTLNLAYLLNGFTVIIGVITMAHFSLEIAPLWANIVTLLSKFVIGRAIFCLEVYPPDSDPKPKGWGVIRYPNPGFWYVHFVAWSAVYFLGHAIWR